MNTAAMTICTGGGGDQWREEGKRKRGEVGKKGDRLGKMQNGKREGGMMVKRREEHEGGRLVRKGVGRNGRGKPECWRRRLVSSSHLALK